MILSLLSAMLVIIRTAGGSSETYQPLGPSVVVVEKELPGAKKVPLRCGEAYEGADVSWRREGKLLPDRGNQITVEVREAMGSDFTCHDATGAVLGRQLVLVRLSQEDDHTKILERNEDGEYIKCLSRNYGGNFHCSWTWSPNREGTVVGVSAKRMGEEGTSPTPGRDNITCTVDVGGFGITCLDRFQCVSAEELDRIELRVFVRFTYRLEEYTRNFSISEIVKPDKIGITKLSGYTFEMEYPATWSKPKSYFPLTFEVKVLPLRRGGNCSSEKVKASLTQAQTVTVDNRKEFRLCVRAQDGLCNSSWSDWSFYEVKKR